MGERYFWLELREPKCVPERKGRFRSCHMAATLREFFAARPSAFITVVTVGEDGSPDFEDAPEVLEMLDGRSSSVSHRHRRTSLAAFASTPPQSPTDPAFPLSRGEEGR